jgi:hypothetical protein
LGVKYGQESTAHPFFISVPNGQCPAHPITEMLPNGQCPAHLFFWVFQNLPNGQCPAHPLKKIAQWAVPCPFEKPALPTTLTVTLAQVIAKL